MQVEREDNDFDLDGDAQQCKSVNATTDSGFATEHCYGRDCTVEPTPVSLLGAA